MKRLAMMILMAMSFPGIAQEAVIFTKGEAIKVKVNGTSDGGLFTDKGTYQYSVIDSVYTLDSNLRANIDKRVAATTNPPVFKQKYQSKNSNYIDDLPFESDGTLVFTDVVSVDGLSDEQLHINAKQFFAEAFKSANDVIQMDDKEAGVIIGKGLSRISIVVMGQGNTFPMHYTIKIQSRDGRYKYTISNIYTHASATDFTRAQDVPIESWFSKDRYFKDNGKPRDINSKYKEELLRVVNELVRDIIERMKSTSNTKGDDW